MFPDRFVRDLPIAAGAYRAHDQLLGGHERQLRGDPSVDHRRMHLESTGDVRHQQKYRVGGEEHLGDDQTSIGTVVQRSLEVLHGVRLVGVPLQRVHEPGE